MLWLQEFRWQHSGEAQLGRGHWPSLYLQPRACVPSSSPLLPRQSALHGRSLKAAPHGLGTGLMRCKMGD